MKIFLYIRLDKTLQLISPASFYIKKKMWLLEHLQWHIGLTLYFYWTAPSRISQFSLWVTRGASILGMARGEPWVVTGEVLAIGAAKRWPKLFVCFRLFSCHRVQTGTCARVLLDTGSLDLSQLQFMLVHGLPFQLHHAHRSFGL